MKFQPFRRGPCAPRPSQLSTLLFIAESIRTRGFAPSRREMCTQFGIASTNAASDRLKYCRVFFRESFQGHRCDRHDVAAVAS